MFADYHVHTDYSDDSEYPMEDVIRDAIGMRLAEICFTDHVDYGIKRDHDDSRGIAYRQGGPFDPDTITMANVDYPRYVQEIEDLREKYGDRITIRLGLEFGMQVPWIGKYQELFNRWPFDFIILSVHEVDDLELWTGDYQRGKTRKEFTEGYYEEMLDLVRNYHDYSVLGHMDMVTRYDPEGAYPFAEIKPLIAEILKTVIKDGKGIELNTSSYRYGLPDLTPARDFLRLYKDLGGKILTIGSDSHKPSDLGSRIEESKTELRSLGFTQFCTFERMTPIFHEL